MSGTLAEAGGYLVSALRMAGRRVRRPIRSGDGTASPERSTGRHGPGGSGEGAAASPPATGAAAEMPSVSVVVPVYNAMRSDASYLREALESVAGQTTPPLEVIVVDDGSEDGSASLVEEFAAAHPEVPLRLLRKANGGQSSARNAGAAVAGGEWLAFLDQDDVWLPDRLEAVAGNLRRGVDLVYTDADTVDEGGAHELHAIHREHRLGGEHPITDVRDALFRDVFVMPGVMTVRAAFYHGLGGFDESLSGYEDDDLFVRAVAAGRVAYVPRTTLLWRMYDENYSRSGRMVASRVRYWRKLLAGYGADRGVARRLTLRFYRECLVQCTGQLDEGDPLARDNYAAALVLVRALGPVDRAAFALTRWAWTRRSRAAFLARWWLLNGLEGRV